MTVTIKKVGPMFMRGEPREVTDEDRQAYEAFYAGEPYVRIARRTGRCEGFVRQTVDRVRDEKLRKLRAKGLVR